MAKNQIEDTPDEQQPEQQPEQPTEQPLDEGPEFEIKDTPQGGVSVPAGESEDPNASIEEKQAKQQEQITAAIQSVRDLLRATGPSREADLAIMKLDEAESWAAKSVVA